MEKSAWHWKVQATLCSSEMDVPFSIKQKSELYLYPFQEGSNSSISPCANSLLPCTPWVYEIQIVVQFAQKKCTLSPILPHEYWTILHVDHFFAFQNCELLDNVLKNVNITFFGNSGTPEISTYYQAQKHLSSIHCANILSSQRKIV